MVALASVISTAFAVYSRKNADKKRKAIDREAMISGRWSEGYSFVPFEPKELDRTFIKKTTSPQGVLIEEEITNSWDGLLAYFQAPNIRFKIRHPLFLAIRFSNVLVILRDALRFPQESEEALRSFICSCGFPLHCRRDPAVKIGHGEFLPPWLIAFRSVAMKQCNQATIHKLADLMKVVKGPALGFVPDDSLLPQRYSPTFDVASLGQLYTKLYAIEFAAAMEDEDEEDNYSNNNNNNQESNNSQQNGSSGDNSVQNGTRKSRTAKRAKTKIEPVQADGLVGFHPCGTPIFHPDESMAHLMPNTAAQLELLNASELDVMMDESSSGSSHHRSSHDKQHRHRIGPQSQLMRSSFESYFIALHGELRMLLEKVVELVTKCVTRQDAGDVDNLRKAYADFTEALSVHAYVEEHVLFKKLSDRVPKVTESYTVDHALEKGRMDEISNIMKKMDARKITDLFLKISELAAVHKIHMDKEELHLLPYFLKTFDDSEISDLIRQCQSTISEKLHEQQTQDATISRITGDPASASASASAASASASASAPSAANAAAATNAAAAAAAFAAVAAGEDGPTGTNRSMATTTTDVDDGRGMGLTGHGQVMTIARGGVIGSDYMRNRAATGSMSTTTSSSSANHGISQDVNTMVMGNNTAIVETQTDSETTSRVMQMAITSNNNNENNNGMTSHVEHPYRTAHPSSHENIAQAQPPQQQQQQAHDEHVHFAPNTYDVCATIGSSINGRPVATVDQQQQQVFVPAGSAHNNINMSNNTGGRYGLAFRPGFRHDDEDDDDRDSDKISLLNPRHQNAIERAIRAAGGMDNDSDSADADVEVYVDPPEIIDDQLFFEAGYVNGDHHEDEDDEMNNENERRMRDIDEMEDHDVERYDEKKKKKKKKNRHKQKERQDGSDDDDEHSNGLMRNKSDNEVQDEDNKKKNRKVDVMYDDNKDNKSSGSDVGGSKEEEEEKDTANNSSSDFGLHHGKQQEQVDIQGGVQGSGSAGAGQDSVLFKKGTIASPNVSFSRNGSGDDDVIALLEEIYN